MVIGYHVIIGLYGFWLPNDPRGSWSVFVGNYDLAAFGKATKVTTQHSLAAAPHDRSQRLAAKSRLQRPPVQLNGTQARAVGRGFGQYCAEKRIAVWACAIMPDHVHLVTGRHRMPVERLAIGLKGSATRRLKTEGIHPCGQSAGRDEKLPKLFVRGEWKVFLDSADDVRRAIRYVERNPLKQGLPRQRWSFVQPFSE